MMKARLYARGAAALALTFAIALPAMADDAGSVAKPTFSRDVAPIFYANCISCHRTGEVAPMSLVDYREVRPWAKSIRQNVKDGIMPPWHADPGFGPFTNDRSLSAAEIDTIVRWVDMGAPQGNKRDLPEVPDFGEAGQWKLGEPDFIIEFEEVSVPGGGVDQFHNLIGKTDFPEDRWLTAVEILPGDRSVVHHVILWQGDAAAAGQPNQEGWLGAWAAGAAPVQFPEKTGRLLKAGAPIIGDMHYHPGEESATDRTRVGLHFAKNFDDIEKELVNLWIINTEFMIPAGDDNYEAHASFTFPQDSTLMSLAPHMHYRGKDFKYTATYPDGSTEKLLEVSRYDFNWQTAYEFVEPKSMPKGTRIDCVAHWNNSESNPDNPDPTKNVGFGPESYDEMMIGFADYIVDEGVRPKAPPNPMPAKIAELAGLYPGAVYEVRIPQGPGRPIQLSAVHLPREGDGGFHVPIGSIVGKAPIHDIVWTGDAFVSKMTIPGQGTNDLTGTIDNEKGTVSMWLTDAQGNKNPIMGRLAQ